jgi:hypothetical protein
MGGFAIAHDVGLYPIFPFEYPHGLNANLVRVQAKLVVFIGQGDAFALKPPGALSRRAACPGYSSVTTTVRPGCRSTAISLVLSNLTKARRLASLFMPQFLKYVLGRVVI